METTKIKSSRIQDLNNHSVKARENYKIIVEVLTKDKENNLDVKYYNSRI